MLDLLNYAYGAFSGLVVFFAGWSLRGWYVNYKATAPERKLNRAAELIAEFEAEKPDTSAREAQERREKDLEVRKQQLQARVAAL